MYAKLENVCKGYAEIVCSDKPIGDYSYDVELGYVHTEDFVRYTDFEKDKIYYTERWTIYWWTGSFHTQIGKDTGYRTRKEAVEHFKYLMKENRGWQ